MDLSSTPLTAEQRRIVTAELHLYYAGFYQQGYAYQQPTFRAVKRWYPRDELPDGVSAGEVAHTTTRVVSDPTYHQAMERLYGPPAVPVWMGERVPVEAAEFRRLATQLPTHLLQPYDLILVKRQTYVGAADKLRMGRQTVADYAHAAVLCLAQQLYQQRWDESAA